MNQSVPAIKHTISTQLNSFYCLSKSAFQSFMISFKKMQCECNKVYYVLQRWCLWADCGNLHIEQRVCHHRTMFNIIIWHWSSGASKQITLLLIFPVCVCVWKCETDAAWPSYWNFTLLEASNYLSISISFLLSGATRLDFRLKEIWQ